jgi:hypothetical protein
MLLRSFAIGDIQPPASNRTFLAGVLPMNAKTMGLLACVLCAGATFVVGQAKTPESDAGGTEAALMRAKLASSQKVAEGLMTQDLSLVHAGALELEKICDATEWHAKEDQVYAHYRDELQRTAKRLARLAQNEDLDGATYTYMHSVTTCMSCHSYCRDVLHVARTEPKLQPTPPPDGEGKAPSTILLR